MKKTYKYTGVHAILVYDEGRSITIRPGEIVDLEERPDNPKFVLLDKTKKTNKKPRRRSI